MGRQSVGQASKWAERAVAIAWAVGQGSKKLHKNLFVFERSCWLLLLAVHRGLLACLLSRTEVKQSAALCYRSEQKQLNLSFFEKSPQGSPYLELLRVYAIWVVSLVQFLEKMYIKGLMLIRVYLF